jgi:hypothetical protein
MKRKSKPMCGYKEKTFKNIGFRILNEKLIATGVFFTLLLDEFV